MTGCGMPSRYACAVSRSAGAARSMWSISQVHAASGVSKRDSARRRRLATVAASRAMLDGSVASRTRTPRLRARARSGSPATER
jgi:hypothetical protein